MMDLDEYTRADNEVLQQYDYRTLDQFDNTREILVALRDAIKDSAKQWHTSQKPHDNIDPKAILITKSGNGHLVNPPPPYNKRFASARSLERQHDLAASPFGRQYDCQYDYIEDLEAFYHVLGWICCSFEGPRQRRLDMPRFFDTIMGPAQVNRIPLKRALVMGDGYELAYMTQYFSRDTSVFPQLMRRMQSFLRSGYQRDGGVNTFGRLALMPPPRRSGGDSECATQDYDTFIGVFNDAIDQHDARTALAWGHFGGELGTGGLGGSIQALGNDDSELDEVHAKMMALALPTEHIGAGKECTTDSGSGLRIRQR